MSFTVSVKNELTRQESGEPCCLSWELAAIVLLKGYLSLGRRGIDLAVSVDYIALARYLFRLFKSAPLGGLMPQVVKKQGVRLGKTCYIIHVAGKEQVMALLKAIHLQEKDGFPDLTRSCRREIAYRCCRRAFLRGAFLAGGSISVRKSGYHLEISCSYHDDALMIKEILHKFTLTASLRRHGGTYCVYLKKAESIGDFLRIIGAHQSLLEFENIRVVKSMRNEVNRLVNCDTANLEKTITSAQRQLLLIDHIDRSIGLHNLPRSLREAARLRRSYPEASLKELGELLNPPLSKSGMNHRFRQLENYGYKLNRK